VAVVIGAVILGVGYWITVNAAEQYYASSAPDRSVYNSAPKGVSIWYRYLGQMGVQARTLRTFSELPKDGVLVVMGPFELTPTQADARRLARWVAAGGRLVLVGSEAGMLASEMDLGVLPEGGSAEATVAPSLPSVYAAGIGGITPGADRMRASGAAWVTHYGDAGGAVLVSSVRGDGAVTWLAGQLPVSNEGIGRADNAALAVLLAGAGRVPVYFDEYHHGYTDETGVWERLGSNGRSLVTLLALATLLLVLARGRRLGPAVPGLEEPPARGVAYIASLAELYRKAGARAEALEALEDGLTRALARRHGTTEAGLARRPVARAAVEASQTLRRSARIGRDEFLAAARGLRQARRELEGQDG
jgi:hypothetical protein